jgi:glucosamine-6-phosphate deaminase
MEVVILPDSAAVSAAVADRICSVVSRVPRTLLGLPTGSTPLPIYQELARRIAAGTAHLSDCRICMLDEYIGLPAGHPQSYRAFIDEHVARPFALSPEQVLAPDVHAPDLECEGARYDQLLASQGGVDLQLLGLGSDGHIGFNEPCSSLASRTRIKALTTQTRADNARFFASPDDVPRHALTQGIGTILQAREVVLIATGAGKAQAASRVIEGPVSAFVPGSALQLHPHAVVMLDEEAAADLTMNAYFREAYRLKSVLGEDTLWRARGAEQRLQYASELVDRA